MSEILRGLGRYCRALGVKGGLLTLLGLAPWIVDDFLHFYLGLEWAIPNWVLFTWFALAFGIANFRVFEGHQSSRLEFQPKASSANLGNDWLIRDPQGSLSIAESFKVTFRVVFDVYNPMQHPAFVRLSVSSIDSDWRVSTDLAGIKFRFGSDRHEADELKLAGLESGEKVIFFTVTFLGADDKVDFGYLGSLSKMVVELTLAQRGYKKRNLSIYLDVSNVHQAMEKQLMEEGLKLVVKPQDSRIVNSYIVDREQIPVLLGILKEYWGVNAEVSSK